MATSATSPGLADTTFEGLRVVRAADVSIQKLDPSDAETRATADRIIAAVREGGEAGLLELAIKYGDIKEGEPHVLHRPALKAAFDALPPGDRALLERVAARVRAFATAQRAAITNVTVPVPGGAAGHTVAPVGVAGCYAPGGRYPLPSSVLMTAVTARVAGVPVVWVASPRPAPVTLAAAYVAGADALLAVGGAQAVAALAYGVGGAPACDVIVGPGNKYVTAAKAAVAGRCGIDMLAGPSECTVLADDAADAELVAADLLAQAEHDTDALPVLVTPSPGLKARVDAALARQLAELPTAAVARAALARRGFAVVAADMDEALAVVDTLAPEHLEVHAADADALFRRVRNYGGAFIGGATAEVFGDYGAGPNHVLPTSGTSRYTGGLSVFTFLRVRTWLRADAAAGGAGAGAGASAAGGDAAAGLAELIDDSAALARLEGLHGHAAAALARRRFLPT